MYRLAQIVMVLGLASTKSTASPLKLHYFSWAMRSADNMEVAGMIATQPTIEYKSTAVWNTEPSLDRALSLALADKLIETHGGKYRLLNKGHSLLAAIMQDDQVLDIEKHFLKAIKKKISDARLQHLTRAWADRNA
jgi:hypothetical protein